MKKALVAATVAALACWNAEASLVKLVPEHGTAKAWTLKTDGNVEYVVRFYRSDVFRLLAAPKLWEGDVSNRTYKVDYADPHNNPANAQILVDSYIEDDALVDFEDKDGAFTFRTSDLTVRFDKANETMAVFSWRGRKILEEAAPLAFFTDAAANPVCRQTLASDRDERFWGGGQQLGRLMHKGRTIAIDCDFNWSDGGAPNPAPFIVSSRGYAVLRHTFASGAYDLTADDAARFDHLENRFDAFYFFGDIPTVVDRYTEATGRPNFLPMWALELGDADAYMTREKETKFPQQEPDGSFTEVTPVVVDRVARKYREDDMPCGWLLVNDGYGCGYTELAPVCARLRDLGFKTGLWTEGALDRIAWEVGVAGTRIQKLDVAWTCQGGAAYKNQYPLQCNRDAFLGITTNANARGFCWTVLGWAGTQRYGICWAGDEYGGWDLIKYMIPGVTGSALSGQAYATTDVDGIFGGSPETYLRDLQWKCWTTAMYVMNGWSDVNKSAWSYPEPYKSEIRRALKHKIRLTPYIYTLMRASFETGAAIVRPLVWNFPNDKVCQGEETKYQFMLGDDFLVAPVYTPEKINRGWWRKGIYLPPKGFWYDYNDGRRVVSAPGSEWIKAYPIDFSKIPVFVRAGAIVPMYDEALTTSEIDRTRVTLDIWPSFFQTTVQRFYEDEGSTLDYLYGEFAERTITLGYDDLSRLSDAHAPDIVVTVSPSQGAYEGMPQKRVWEYAIHTQMKPAQVLTDGYALLEAAPGAAYANIRQGWCYDPDDKMGTVKVRLLARDYAEGAKLVVRFPNDAKFSPLFDNQPYPVPDEAAEEALAETVSVKAVDLLKDRTIVDGDDMVATDGMKIHQAPEPIYTKIRGHVATHRANAPDARFTFRIFAGNHVIGEKQIFERANMKGDSVPQLIEVNLPADSQWVRYEFTADDASEASKSAKGVWKGVEYLAE